MNQKIPLQISLFRYDAARFIMFEIAIFSFGIFLSFLIFRALMYLGRLPKAEYSLIQEHYFIDLVVGGLVLAVAMSLLALSRGRGRKFFSGNSRSAGRFAAVMIICYAMSAIAWAVLCVGSINSFGYNLRISYTMVFPTAALAIIVFSAVINSMSYALNELEKNEPLKFDLILAVSSSLLFFSSLIVLRIAGSFLIIAAVVTNWAFYNSKAVPPTEELALIKKARARFKYIFCAYAALCLIFDFFGENLLSGEIRNILTYGEPYSPALLTEDLTVIRTVALCLGATALSLALFRRADKISRGALQWVRILTSIMIVNHAGNIILLACCKIEMFVYCFILLTTAVVILGIVVFSSAIYSKLCKSNERHFISEGFFDERKCRHN